MRYLIIFFLIVNSSAEAADKESLLIGGSQVSERNSYTYIGVLHPLNGSKIGDGWFSKVSASWLTYEFDTFANGGDVTAKAKVPGVDVGVGHAWTGANYSLSLGLSAGYRYINLSPNLPDEDNQGDTFTVTPDVQARYQFNPSLDADLISSYAFGQKTSFNRLRFGMHPNQEWRIGLEATRVSGQNFMSRNLGIFASSYLSSGLGFEVSTGYSQDDNGKNSPYIGFGFAKFF